MHLRFGGFAMKITSLNLWVLGQLFAVNTNDADATQLDSVVRDVPNQIESTSAAHLRRCIKAGLLDVSGKRLLLTDAGVEALRADIAASVARAALRKAPKAKKAPKKRAAKAPAIVQRDGVTAIRHATFEASYRVPLEFAATLGDSTIEDDGTCVLGAGVYCYVIPKGKRKPRKLLIASGPFQGNLSQQRYCAPVLAYLTEHMPEIAAFYSDGYMD